MKCLQKLYSSPSWLVVSLCLFCTLFLTMINTTSASALEYSGVLDANNQNAIGVCNTNGSGSLSGHPCSDFLYIVFSFSGTINTAGTPYVQYANVNYRFINLADPTVIKISENVSLFTVNVNYLSSDWQLHYSLTDTYPSNCPGVPSGSITLTENGTFDVTSYATAVVDVPPEIQQGDYHDDLVDLKQAIILVPAVCLVIYFFYAIYKMIMGGVRR